LDHHWQLYAQNGTVLAWTVRVHNGGKAAQVFWKLLTVTGLDADNDNHVQLRGADETPLAHAGSVYDKPAIVTIADAAGRQVPRRVRDKQAFTLGNGSTRSWHSTPPRGPAPCTWACGE
jgi:hypothetical protein